MAETPNDDQRSRPLGDLIEQLSADVKELVRAEVALARAEMLVNARRLAVAAGLGATGALLGLLALGTLTAAAVIALANVWAAWLAALVVAVVLAALALAMLAAGVRIGRRAAAPAPAATIASIKEDLEWVKTQARSGMT